MAAKGAIATTSEETTRPCVSRSVHAVLYAATVGFRLWISAYSTPMSDQTSTKLTTIIAIATRPKSAGVKSRARTAVLPKPIVLTVQRKAVDHAALRRNFSRRNGAAGRCSDSLIDGFRRDVMPRRRIGATRRSAGRSGQQASRLPGKAASQAHRKGRRKPADFAQAAELREGR